MPRTSAGVLVYRRSDAGRIEVLIGHMGGPFWARKDAGGWSIPKGEYDGHEDPEKAARREFQEELGCPVPAEALVDLGTARQPSGKVLRVWAGRGELDPDTAMSNTFELEWPRGSGVVREFPEIDRVGWFELEEAREKLVTGQRPFLDRLLERLG